MRRVHVVSARPGVELGMVVTLEGGRVIVTRMGPGRLDLAPATWWRRLYWRARRILRRWT